MSQATHALPAAQLDLLSAGGGDAATVRTLRAAQLSKHLLLIRALTDAAAGHPESGRLARGYELLARVQRTHPAEVDTVLLHPHVGAWAVRCLERLYGVADADGSLETDLSYLAELAAVAAIRAGLRFEIDVPVRDGGVLLPGLGIATPPPGEPAEATEASVWGDGSAAWVRVFGVRLDVPSTPDRDAVGWTGLRRLRARTDGIEITVDLDDQDPYRGHAYPDVAGRLPDSEVREWSSVFEAGWALLVRDHRSCAEALAAGLRSIVAQVSAEPGRSISATSTDAFGSIAMSRPADAATLAVTLIHEFQHAKLSALLDLVPLYELRTGTRYYAPWRDDPRPLGGLLQGAYAFLGVTDFWRRHRGAVSASRADLASFEFARWREQTARAVDELAGSAELTDAGRQVIEGLRATLRQWAGEQVPEGIAAQARDSATDHRARWRVRNLRPASDAIGDLAARWRRGEPAGTAPVGTEVVTGAAPARTDTAQFRLWHLRMTSPERFTAVCAGAGRYGEWADISDADIAYVRSDYDEAARAYLAAIGGDPGRVSNWVGLGLARLRTGDTDAGLALLGRPEVLLAVHRVLADDGDCPAPEALARWLRGTDRCEQEGDPA
jgi:HEXXH motif-containing protein